MELFVFLVFVSISGLIVGALARLAVPGPDPMPWWQTILLGIAGSLLGGLVSAALGMSDAGQTGDALGGLVISVGAATLLLVLYRKVVLNRPITGPGAHRR